MLTFQTVRKRCASAAMIAAGLVCLAAPAAAQDNMVKKREGVTYYRLWMMDFKSGRESRAMEIINKYFVAADKELKLENIEFVTVSGTWDVIAAFPIGDNLSELEYYRTPAGVEWEKTFVKVVGNEAEAKKLLEEFSDLIDREEYMIVYRPPKR